MTKTVKVTKPVAAVAAKSTTKAAATKAAVKKALAVPVAPATLAAVKKAVKAPKTALTKSVGAKAAEVKAAIKAATPKAFAKPTDAEIDEALAAAGIATKETKPQSAALKAAHATQKANKAMAEAGAPVTPLTKLLTSAGFNYVESKPVAEGATAHGFTHADGRAAVFTHDNSNTNIGANWTIRANGEDVTGKTAKQLAEALHKPAVANKVLNALELLSKLTKGTFLLSNLTGDSNYTQRMQLLKALRGVDKVLAKETGIHNVIKEFYTAVGVTPDGTINHKEQDFITKAKALLKAEQKTNRAVAKVEKEQIKEVLKASAPQRVVHDNKPILPAAKKLNAKQQKAADDKAKADLVLQIADKRKKEEYTPLAVPRPDAEITVNLDDVCLLVDPANGIVLLCLEKPNSQGAICVYNNGSRVAAGVLLTKDLVALRREVSDDLVRDVNQFLHPITAGVIVTPVAEQHLTAVLEHCKENIAMTANKTIATKKFAAPVASAKATAKKTVVEKEVKAPKAEKAVKAAKAPKAEKVARVKYTDDTKIKQLHKGENPYREGTKARNTFDVLAKAKTFGDFVATLAKSKKDVYEAAYFVKWASMPHGKAPAYIAVG